MGSPVRLSRQLEIWHTATLYGLSVNEAQSPKDSIWKGAVVVSLDTRDYHSCVLSKEEARAMAEALLKWSNEA